MKTFFGKFSLRAKLMAIPLAATLGFLVVIVSNQAVVKKVREHLSVIEGRYIPMMEAGPRIAGEFDRLKRALQDAVSAQDEEALEATRQIHDRLLKAADEIAPVVDGPGLSVLKEAIRTYYARAFDVSRRLMAGETGTGVVDAITVMQQKEKLASASLAKVTSFDRHHLNEAFASVRSVQARAAGTSFWVGVVSTALVVGFGFAVSRGLLLSLSAFSSGFARFGAGDLKYRVPVTGSDELGQIASQANQMAGQIEELMLELRKKGESLALLNRELESFSYSVAHDLRAPLRAMQGFSKNILEDHAEVLPAEAARQLERIVVASRKMGQLVDGLLSLSQINRKEIVKSGIDLSAYAQDILDGFRDEASPRKASVTVEPNCLAQGDPRLMHVVLTNLLGNAWKFTGKQAEARIEFGRTSKDGQTVFFVRDNGAGFDMRYADKLFGTFQRLNTEDEYAGTGIGLATVQRVIHRHGGTIWAESELGRGTTFFFTLAEGATK